MTTSRRCFIELSCALVVTACSKKIRGAYPQYRREAGSRFEFIYLSRRVVLVKRQDNSEERKQFDIAVITDSEVLGEEPTLSTAVEDVSEGLHLGSEPACKLLVVGYPAERVESKSFEEVLELAKNRTRVAWVVENEVVRAAGSSDEEEAARISGKRLPAAELFDSLKRLAQKR